MFINETCNYYYDDHEYEENKEAIFNKRDIDIDEDCEEDEDTLSFYEFSMNSEPDSWGPGHSSKESSQNSSFKSSQHEQQEEDDYFEFFSEELKRTTPPTALISLPENIIFCGKIIPHKHSPPISAAESPINSVKSEKNRTRRGIFKLWSWNYKSETPRNKIDGTNQKQSKRKRNKINSFPVKLSVFTTSITKSSWYLFLFGITRFESEMQLRDMKNRQQISGRPSPSISLSRFESSDIIIDNNGECKGAWRLLRVLSCGGGYHQTDAVVPSTTVVGRLPHV